MSDEPILLIKRKPAGDFAGDKSWQVAPYRLRDEEHARKTVEWLRSSTGADFNYRIVSANAERSQL
jgi:hypothetical protein